MYKTKTGTELRVIQGGGLGDGIPQGKLRVATEADIMDKGIFAGASIVVGREVYGDQRPYIKVTLQVDAKQYRKAGAGGTVLDVSNWLYQRFGLSVHYPTVGVSKRAKGGKLEMDLSYQIGADVARDLGLSNDWAARLILKRA